jgi:hypothetical protein
MIPVGIGFALGFLGHRLFFKKKHKSKAR